jgi:hypothetical protein
MTYEQTYTEEIISGNTWDGYDFSIAKVGTNYTAATIKVQIREKPEKELILEKTITPDVAINELIEFTFALSANDTAKLKGNCQADIQITAGSDVRTPILFNFTVTKPITK